VGLLRQCLMFGRFPQGKRGLKSSKLYGVSGSVESLPAREAWIEIFKPVRGVLICAVASRKGSVD